MKFYKLQRKFAIICLISILLIVPPTQAYAASFTVEQCQEALKNYAIDFVEKIASEGTHYSLRNYTDDINSERAISYLRDEKCNYSAHDPGMGMDCVGWVSYAIHHCYGIGSNDQFDYFATPQSGVTSEYFEQRTDIDNIQAGDIVIINNASMTHVEIYIGNEEIVDCIRYNKQEGIKESGVLRRSADFRGDSGVSYARLKDTSAIHTLIDSYNGTGLTGGSGTTINYSKFFFNGIPDGQYSLATKQSIFKVLINSIKELVNFFTGLITYLFRGLIIGIISIFDRLINNTVQSVSDAPKSIEETGVTATSADDPYSMDRAVTIEGLVFNDIDLFDINIFKVD